MESPSISLSISAVIKTSMFQDVQNAGYIMLALTIMVLGLGIKSKAKMEIRAGDFEGPVWFLMAVISVLLIGFGSL
jgi:hypothetical protein